MTRLPAMPYPMNKGQEKGSGQPAMNRSKQAGMGKKATGVLLVGLALASVPSRRGAAGEESPPDRLFICGFAGFTVDYFRTFQRTSEDAGRAWLDGRSERHY